MSLCSFRRCLRGLAVVATVAPLVQLATAPPASAAVLISPPIIEMTWNVTYDPTSVSCQYQQTATATVSFSGVGYFQIEAYADNGAAHGGFTSEDNMITATYEAVGASARTWTLLASTCYPIGAHGVASAWLNFYECSVDCGEATGKTLVAGDSSTCHWGHVAATC